MHSKSSQTQVVYCKYEHLLNYYWVNVHSIIFIIIIIIIFSTYNCSNIRNNCKNTYQMFQTFSFL